MYPDEDDKSCGVETDTKEYRDWLKDSENKSISSNLTDF